MSQPLPPWDTPTLSPMPNDVLVSPVSCSMSPNTYDHDLPDSESSCLEGCDARIDDPIVPRNVVLRRIEEIVLFQCVLEPLGQMQVPNLGDHRTLLHTTYCRNMTSIVLVADFCHHLLQNRRTTTIREVYYHFVTHFRNQAECDRAIWDLAKLLQVSRPSLGLMASPKGWCCGSLELLNHKGEVMWNGRALDVHGIPITATLTKSQVRANNAKCILVIEKEGIYTRLSEDKFFERYPCILVTGKGFPDIATRQWVHHLQFQLNLPIYGLCDANPFGVAVLQTYYHTEKMGYIRAQAPTTRRRCNIGWLGLRPSQLKNLKLPDSVFQKLTDLDIKRIESLQNETSMFCQQGQVEARQQELQDMQSEGWKVELEALNWLGMDYLCRWVQHQLEQHEANMTDPLAPISQYII